MARWKLGESDIEALIASGELQKLTGDAANGERLLKKAAVTLETDAPRSIETRIRVRPRLRRRTAGQTALLADQGLWPTTKADTMRSSEPYARNSAQASDSPRCAGDVTNWNIRATG